MEKHIPVWEILFKFAELIFEKGGPLVIALTGLVVALRAKREVKKARGKIRENTDAITSIRNGETTDRIRREISKYHANPAAFSEQVGAWLDGLIEGEVGTRGEEGGDDVTPLGQ